MSDALAIAPGTPITGFPGGVGRAAWRMRARLTAVAATLAVVLAVQVFFGTGSTFRFDAGDGYYDQLADAFLSGQLYLKTEPPTELLALANPYDPVQNAPYRFHDASLYGGHYYLYFGPFPALLHAGWRFVAHQSLDDGVVEVAAAFLATAGFWWILERFRRDYAPDAQWWIGLLAALGFGVGGMMLYLVGRPAVYHEALLVAVACTVGSWAALVLGFRTPAQRSRWVGVAGLLIGCAVASRITYLGYAVTGGLAVLGCGVACRQPRSSILRGVVLFAVPLGLIGAALMVYNWARFDSPFEFGLSYQLAGATQASGCGRNLASYFGLYLGAIPRLSGRSPFVPFQTGPSVVWPVIFPFQRFLPAARGMLLEPPLVSPFVQAPIALLALATPALAYGAFRKYAGRRVLLLLAIGLLGGSLIQIPLLSCANGIDFRYYADLAPALTLLGSLGFVAAVNQARQRSDARLKVAVLGSGAVSLVVTLLAGTLLGLASWGYAYQKQSDAVASVTTDWLVARNLVVPPSSIQTFPQDLKDAGLVYSGIFDDGWLRQSASFTLHQPTTAATVVVRGTLLVPPDGSTGTDVRVLVDGQQVAEEFVMPGEFRITAAAPSGKANRHVDLVFDRIQQLPAPDTRQAAAHLGYLALE